MRVVVAGLSVMALGGALAPAAAADPFAVGAGQNAFVGTGGPVHLMVSAHGTGPDVTGYVESRGDLGIGEFRQGGAVTCQRVAGNRAAIKYRVDSAQGPGAPPLGTVIEVFVEDNGPPGSGVPDANATREPEFPPLGELDAGNCDDPTTQPEWNPIDSGNYTVSD
jgi:hypothetical protein